MSVLANSPSSGYNHSIETTNGSKYEGSGHLKGGTISLVSKPSPFFSFLFFPPPLFAWGRKLSEKKERDVK